MSHRASGGSPNYSFKPSVKALGLFAVVFPLFIALGLWQLQRADEKRTLNALRDVRSEEPPVALKDVVTEDIEDLRFQPVLAEGQYDGAHQFLLDNQLERQAVGYHVLTPFRLSGTDRAVLVNRGWLPQGTSRQNLPDIHQLPAGVTRVTGLVDRFHRVGFQLEGANIPTAGWPALVQVPDAQDRRTARLSGTAVSGIIGSLSRWGLQPGLACGPAGSREESGLCLAVVSICGPCGFFLCPAWPPI